LTVFDPVPDNFMPLDELCIMRYGLIYAVAIPDSPFDCSTLLGLRVLLIVCHFSNYETCMLNQHHTGS
jgi:hypothetical protein